MRRWLMGLLLLSAVGLQASGPRYVTGPPFFTGRAGVPVGWANRGLLYSTDAGDLSGNVSHTAADALVAKAAAVWNVPVANISLGQGGMLAEHVSAANVYIDAAGVHYPADVGSENDAAVPIAVIYDADGSVTDTLLGAGASDPSGCRQNAVTESVDLFDPAGYILHAVVVLNGRCTGPAAEQQMQMQYQLERVFGRVLGLGWSQANDNVFTGTPVPTYGQALHWPIMHPVDILCGAYTYQCLPQPFQLRTDDVASLVLLYGLAANAPAGKQVSLGQATAVMGRVSFPAGEGMAGVNVVGQRINLNETDPEPWVSVSGVSGALFREAGPTPVEVAEPSAAGSLGTFDASYQGFYELPYVPVEAGNQVQAVQVSTEAINPLYTGSYAVGPYMAGQVTPSGSGITETVRYQGLGSVAELDLAVPDAAVHCGTGMDGTEASPAQVDATGWSAGLLCGYGHAAWMGVDVLPNRTLTVEVTALDGQGYGTTAKAMPVLGAWADGDPLGSLPTLGIVSNAFNSLVSGMSSVGVNTGQASRIRVAVADQRGDGRPDFAYQARIFYAGNVFPARVPVTGGVVTVSGMGFRLGNQVFVNGVSATGLTWTANAISVRVPGMAAAGAVSGTAVDVQVVDEETGAVSTIAGGLTYDASASLPNGMKLVSAPAGTVYVGDMAANAFSVQVVRGDGVTPVSGEAVLFSTGAGTVEFGACGGPSCVQLTDALGFATTSITATGAGRIILQAADGPLTQAVSLTAVAKAGSLRVVSTPSGAIYAGQAAALPFTVQVLTVDGIPMPNRAVVLSASGGAASFAACAASICQLLTDNNGMASSYVIPGGAGLVMLQAADGLVTTTSSFTVLAGAASLRITSAPAATAFVNSRASIPFDVVLLGPDGVTPLPAKTLVLSAQLVGSGGGGSSSAVTFSICDTMTCRAATDYWGQVATWVDVHAIGTYLVQAAYGSITASTTIQVLPQIPGLRIVSAPSGQQVTGAPTATPFKIQTLDFDGTTPLPGQYVTLSAIPGTVTFDACSVSSCLVVTDANGFYTTQVTPLVTGPITLEAVMVPIVLQATFTGVSRADTMQLVSAPQGTVYTGATAATAFSVRVLAAGLIPVAGRSVALSVTSGSAVFTACGSMTCTLTTDSNGLIASGVIPLSSGTVTLLANDTGVILAASFDVTARAGVLTAVDPHHYVAAEVTSAWTQRVTATLNGSPAVGQPVSWTGGPGIVLASSQSFTGDRGVATMLSTVGPLAAGASVLTTACAWPATCVQLQATGVSARDFQVVLISGGGQSTHSLETFAPVVMQVVDTAGHPVAGAAVTIFQTLRPAEHCPGTGRCSVGPVLASSDGTGTSGEDGMVVIVPFIIPSAIATAEHTDIAVTAGFSGFMSTGLERGP